MVSTTIKNYYFFFTSPLNAILPFYQQYYAFSKFAKTLELYAQTTKALYCQNMIVNMQSLLKRLFVYVFNKLQEKNMFCLKGKKWFRNKDCMPFICFYPKVAHSPNLDPPPTPQFLSIYLYTNTTMKLKHSTFKKPTHPPTTNFLSAYFFIYNICMHVLTKQCVQYINVIL